MNNQVEKLNAAQDQARLLRLESLDQSNQILWAAIVNKFQVTSAKQWDETVGHIVAKARVPGRCSDGLLDGLMRLQAKHTPKELEL